jgi:hypothetical protein
MCIDEFNLTKLVLIAGDAETNGLNQPSCALKNGCLKQQVAM